MTRVLSAAAAAFLSVAAAPALAAEGWVGVLKHDVTFVGEVVGLGAAGVEDGFNVHLGVRSERIDSLGWLARPYVYGFASVNTQGDTSFAGVGLGWKFDVAGPGGLYIRPGIGLVVHDGEEELPDFREPGLSEAEVLRRVGLRDEKIEFGSRVLFQPEFSVGYQLNDRWSAELSYVHLSHGQILGSGKNQGLDEVGVRVNRRF
jgi:hypothetical protein